MSSLSRKEIMPIYKDVIELYKFSRAAKFRTYQRWFFGTPNEYVEQFVPKKGNIIDLGCGWGVFSNLLAIKSPERQVYGVDLDRAKIAWAKRTIGTGRKNIRFEVQDLESISLSQVDAIILYDVMHHLDDSAQMKVLEQCRDKLSPGGRLILKENDVVPLWKLAISYVGEAIADRFNFTIGKKIHWRSRSEWADLIESFGFAVIHNEHIKTWYGFHVPHSLFVAEKR